MTATMTSTLPRPVPTLTEVAVAADALVALLTARLVPAGRAMEACRVVGIAAADLDDARIRAQLGRTRPPRVAEMLPTLTAPDFSRRPAGRAFRGTNGSHHDGTVPKATPRPRAPCLVPDPVPPDTVADLPEGDFEGNSVPRPDRFCVPCGMWKVPDDFPPAGKRCRACVNRARRERYLSVERAAALERATLRFVMAVDDPVVTCGRCRGPLLAGEDVAAVAVELIHARHLEKDPCG